MSASIKVENRSQWPTWLIRWIVRKASADAGVTQYTWTQKRRGRGFFGRGGRFDGYGGVARRFLTARSATWLFHYFKYKQENSCRDHVPHSTIAVLCKVIRHEVEHAGEGHPRHFRKDDGSRDVWLMEMHCNEMAAKWVNSLDWPGVYREWIGLARAERARTAKPAPDLRIAKLRDKHADALKTWERKLKLAQGKVRKYRQRVTATERRMVAISGQSPQLP